jgi:hypothetical protein
VSCRFALPTGNLFEIGSKKGTQLRILVGQWGISAVSLLLFNRRSYRIPTLASASVSFSYNSQNRSSGRHAPQNPVNFLRCPPQLSSGLNGRLSVSAVTLISWICP